MRHVTIALVVGLFSATALADDAAAGGWGLFGGGCPCGGYSAGGAVYYASPSYSYAAPTTTVYPHYVIQPNYIVRQTYVVPQNIYVGSAPAYPARVDLVNQGQYFTDEATLPGYLGDYQPWGGYGIHRGGHGIYRGGIYRGGYDVYHGGYGVRRPGYGVYRGSYGVRHGGYGVYRGSRVSHRRY